MRKLNINMNVKSMEKNTKFSVHDFILLNYLLRLTVFIYFYPTTVFFWGDIFKLNEKMANFQTFYLRWWHTIKISVILLVFENFF